MHLTVRGRWTLILISALFVAGCDSGSGGDTVGGSSPTSRSWVVPDAAAALTPDQRAAFSGGSLYLNAHTAANPNGEIRGQLDRAGTVRFASLDGAQETPATMATAVGAGVLSVEEATGKISGFVVTTGLQNVTVAHVHLGARGVPGDVIVPLSGGPDTWVVPDGAAPLTADQVSAFLAGALYFNVHTTANPNGEYPRPAGQGRHPTAGGARRVAGDAPRRDRRLRRRGPGRGREHRPGERVHHDLRTRELDRRARAPRRPRHPWLSNRPAHRWARPLGGARRCCCAHPGPARRFRVRGAVLQRPYHGQPERRVSAGSSTRPAPSASRPSTVRRRRLR